MKLWLALFFAGAALACGAEKSVDQKIGAALAEAEKFAAAGQWREALDAGDRLRTLCREQRGEDDPDTALADLFLGEVRDHLGDRTLAEAHFRRALAIQEKVLRPEASELVTTLTRLGALLKDGARYDEAAGLLQRALDLEVKIRDAGDPETAVACTNLARVFRLKGDYDRAASLLERALAIERPALGGTDPATIASLHELAQAHELAGNISAAEQDSAERVVAAEARFGPQTAELAAALSEWGRLAERQEHFSDAEPRFRRALAIRETLSGGDPELAESLTQLGGCLRNLERFDEAQPLLQRALDLRVRSLGPEHADTAASYRDLAWIFRLKRDFEAARPLFEKALAIREQTLGANDSRTIESLAELGDLDWLRGAYDDAAALLETRRYRAEEAFGPKSEATAAAWHSLAIVYESAKRWPEATQSALRSLQLHEQRLGPADPETLGEMVLLSRICSAAGALEPALTQFARLARWFGQHPEASAQSRAELLRQFAIATLRAGKMDEAAPLFRESRQAHEIAFGASDPATLRSIADLWTCYDETRQPALALEVARELAARTESALGADAPAAISIFDRLAQLCLTLGDKRDAAKWCRRALDGRRRHFGDGSAESLDALAQAAAWFEDARDFQTAAELRTERLGAVERKFGSESDATASACGELAMCYFRQRDLRSARGMFDQQLTLIAKRAGVESAGALTAVARLGDVAMAARDWPAAVRERERLATGCARHFGSEHLEHGRALLLLGEALLATNANARAETALRDAQRIIRSAGDEQAGIASRAACALARAALRRGDVAGAKRQAREALAGTFANEEPLAESFSS
ncbi:MAG TPA: tetratricopeptide repeat protein, partial [Chthoniobacteraceae bacterium]|nr:tetratricopeptide repeat protein [Chthoniobacteraceae bacterium]